MSNASNIFKEIMLRQENRNLEARLRKEGRITADSDAARVPSLAQSQTKQLGTSVRNRLSHSPGLFSQLR